MNEWRRRMTLKIVYFTKRPRDNLFYSFPFFLRDHHRVRIFAALCSAQFEFKSSHSHSVTWIKRKSPRKLLFVLIYSHWRNKIFESFSFSVDAELRLRMRLSRKERRFFKRHYDWLSSVQRGAARQFIWWGDIHKSGEESVRENDNFSTFS